MALASVTWLQAALSVLAPFIVDDLTLSRSEFGLMFAIFGLAGALGAPLMGRAVDALGGRMVLALAFFVTAVGTVALAVSPAFALMLAACAVAGLGLASGNPATNKLIAVHVTPARRGPIVGFKQAGPPLGVLIAGISLPTIASAAGWRPALAVTVVLPLLGLSWLMRWVPRDKPRMAETRRARTARESRSMVVWLTFTGLAVSTGVGAVVAFLPLYAQERIGMSPYAAGVVAAVVGVVGMLARVLWGWLGARFARSTTLLLLIGWLSVLATVALWVAPVLGAWAVWMGGLAAGASMMAWHAVGWLALIDEVKSAAVGGASGIVQLGTSVGFGIGPLIFGFLVDVEASYSLAWAFLTFLFMAAALATSIWRRAVGVPVVDAGGR